MNNSETIEIIRRDTQLWTVNFTDENGDPINLNSKTVRFTVKKSNKLDVNNDDNAVIEKEITSHTNASGGVTTISLTSSETDIVAGQYWYDIQLTYTDTVMSIKRGMLIVTQDVTVSI